MAFIPTLNAIKVVILGTILGQQVVIDITIGTPAVVGGTDLDDAADACSNWFDTELRPHVSSQYLVNEVKAYDLSSASAPVVSHPVAYVGGIAPPTFGLNTALVTTFLTANRGRSGRGRNYLGGIPIAAGGPGTTSAGYLADIVGAWSALPTYLSPLGFDHVVISNYTGGAARPAGLKQQVIGYRTNSDYDSQRRRLVGRGA